MSAPVPNALLSQFSEFVAAHFGLHFPRERSADLERAMRAASQEFGQHDVSGCIQSLFGSPLTRAQTEILASHLTVGETYFFREKRSLEIIQQHILPALIRTSRPATRQLRIWSAGCATGEEPYSIAILLSSMIRHLKDWNITILATDVNARSLRRASEGVYGEWSFRDTPPWVKPGYFTPAADGRWAIAPSIKKRVMFAYLNLMDDAYPAPFDSHNALDVILCRNVLMYFTPQAMKRIIHHLYQSLADGGWLIVSATETSHDLFSEFVPVSFAGSTLYRKAGGRREAVSGFASGEDEKMAPSEEPSLAVIGQEQREAEIPAPENGRRPPADAGQQGAPQMPEISYAEALALHRQGQYEEAERVAIAFLSRNPGDQQAMLLLARLCANRGKLQEALDWCDRAVVSDKIDARAHYLRATILQEQGLVEEASLSLKRALYADPAFVLAHFALGSLALRKGKTKESQKHFANSSALLAKYRQDDLLPESDGLTAGRLREIIAVQIDRNYGAKHSAGLVGSVAQPARES